MKFWKNAQLQLYPPYRQDQYLGDPSLFINLKIDEPPPPPVLYDQNLNKCDIDYKTFSYAKRDYSKFDEQKFISDFSCKSASFLDSSTLSLNCKCEKLDQNLSPCDDLNVPKKMTKNDIKNWIPSLGSIQRSNHSKYRDKVLQKLKRIYSF